MPGMVYLTRVRAAGPGLLGPNDLAVSDAKCSTTQRAFIKLRVRETSGLCSWLKPTNEKANATALCTRMIFRQAGIHALNNAQSVRQYADCPDGVVYIFFRLLFGGARVAV